MIYWGHGWPWLFKLWRVWRKLKIILGEQFTWDLVTELWIDCRFFTGAFIEIIWGYLFYKFRDRLRKRRYIFISAGAFLGLNLLRMAIQLGRYHRIQDTATYILYWFSSIGLLCAICVIVFSFAAIHSRKATVVNQVICWLASYTFSIYLLHPVVNSFLDMYEVRSRLSEALLKFHIGGVGKEILYMICIIFIVVSICLAISCVLRGCKMAMVRVVSGKADKWGNEGIVFFNTSNVSWLSYNSFLRQVRSFGLSDHRS